MAALAAALALAAGCSDLVPPAMPFPHVGAALPISGESPFHDCSHGWRIMLDSEVEPSLAVDPDAPTGLVVAWQQDRNLRGGALAILTATSADGGRSWETSKPSLTTCAGGPYDLASDPAVSIGADRAYLATIGIHLVGSESQPGLDNDVVVQTSTDRGRTWGPPEVVATTSDPLVSFDKETIVADPRTPGRAFVLWVEYTQPSADEPAKTNRTYVSRTNDGGGSWSTPTLVYVGADETQFHQLMALGDGSIVDVFIQAPTLSDPPPLAAKLLAVRSIDDGRTWSDPATVAEVMFTAATDPTGKDSVRGTGQGILAAAGPDGALYVCWAEQLAEGESFLAVVRSDDRGTTWSSPGRVVSTTTGQPFVPQVAVAGDGRVGVTWYQITGDETGDQLATEAWFAWSTNRGSSWQSLRLSGPFDLHTAKLTDGGDFVGDYEGLVGLPGGFAAAYAVARPLSHSGPTDVFFSSIDLGP
jgi:hypothetical protein